MSQSTKNNTLQANLKKAKSALKKKNAFEAERIALSVLESARSSCDFNSMCEVLPILRDARSLRVEAALTATEEVRLLERPIQEGETVEPGCYLVEPPRVGADARNLRLAALEQEVPVAIVCREPITQMQLRPIVAIGRITVRARVLPADNDAQPDLNWFMSAMNEIGETAIDPLDTGAAILKQIDGLMDRLDSIPDHPRLHDALEEICQIANSAQEPDTHC